MCSIRSSHGECTVAKEQYFLPRTGWFGDRSACYLAAGKPVLSWTPDSVMRCTPGLFAFREVDDLVASVEAVEADHGRHSRWAREVAREHFAAERVLFHLMDAVGVAGARAGPLED